MVVKARLASLDETGAVVGRLSGLGTLGAIVGTFVTGFLLVEAFPTSAVVLAVGAVLVAAGVVLTVRVRGRRAVAAPLAGALPPRPAPAPPPARGRGRAAY